MNPYPDPSKQTPGKYLPGDILKMKDGSIGVVGEIHINPAQEDPHYCSYQLEKVPGFRLEYLAWWREDEVVDVVFGVLHLTLKLMAWRSL